MDPRSLLPHLHSLLGHQDGLAEFLTLMQQRDELNRLGVGDFLAEFMLLRFRRRGLEIFSMRVSRDLWRSRAVGRLARYTI